MISSISSYANSGEINFVVEEKYEAINRVIKEISSRETPVNTYDFDGVRLEFEDWWFNIRPSNTEPYLRFLAEAKNEELLERKVRTIRQILEPFIQDR